MLFMLSETTLKRAKTILAGNPTRLSLLEYLWPFVKDFDFESGGRLELKQPEHELFVLAPIPKGKHRTPFSLENHLVGTGKTVRYSHRAIRCTIDALGLSVGNKFSDGLFRIQKRKK